MPLAVVATWACGWGDNEPGSVALVAAAALFLVMCVTGAPISRAKVGEHELAFHQRMQFVEELTERVEQKLEDEPGPVRGEALEVVREAVAEVATSSPARLQAIRRAQHRAIGYEHAVASAFSGLGEVVSLSGRDYGFDLLVLLGERRLAVMIKFSSRPLATATVARTVVAGIALMEQGTADAVMLVSNVELTSKARESVMRHELGFARWEPPDPPEPMLAIARGLLYGVPDA